MIKVINEAKKMNIPKNCSCEILQIDCKRIERWENQLELIGLLDDQKSGPKFPLHTITPMEKKAVLDFVGKSDTVDYSYQKLAIKGAEMGLFFVSASSIRKVLIENGLGEDRRTRKKRSSRTNNKPNRPEDLNGPNQCWCWDISYIRTDVKRFFWFLYVVLDEWSRKIISWRISGSLSQQEGLLLIDDAMISENLIDLENKKLPVIISDRGTQMRAKNFSQMCKDLGLQQEFSRPRTPNDNPFIESFFGTTKTLPAYPGWFLSDDISKVKEYFEKYIAWYNEDHYHSRIGYVTPNHKHDGLAEKIIENRKNMLTQQKKKRKKYWSMKKPRNEAVV